MDYVINDLRKVSKNKEFYFRKTPAFIFIFIYMVILILVGLYIFSNYYILPDTKEYNGSISINQNLIVGEKTRNSSKNNFDIIYSAKFTVSTKVLPKIDASKKAICFFKDVNGNHKRLECVIDKYEKASGDNVVSYITVYNYELKKQKISYIKPNTSCKVTIPLKKEKLIDVIKKKIF
ncbi:MAG: hypothetical protein ABF289_14540 [Clostridiales bacterium]